MNSASAVLLNALDEQRPAQFSGKSWGRARLFLAKSLSVISLSFDAQGKVQGLAPEYLAQTYRRFCDTRGGESRQPYSRRQRQNVLHLFKAINILWGELLSQPLLPPQNYSRIKRRQLIDLSAVRHYRPGDVERLRVAFTKRVAQSGMVNAGETELESAFYGLVFALITFAGVTFPGCFASMCRLQIRDLPPSLYGQLIIPRSVSRNLWMSVAMDAVTRLCLAALVSRLARFPKSARVRRRQLRSFNAPQAYLVGMDSTPKNLSYLREGFNVWLLTLCEEAHVPPVTLETLIGVAQWRLPDVYSSEVILSLTGAISYHPLPPDQTKAILQSYRIELPLPKWDLKSVTDEPASLKLSPKNNVPRVAPDEEETGFDESIIKELFEVSKPFVQKEISAGAMATRLHLWLCEQLEVESPSNDPASVLADFYSERLQPLLTKTDPSGELNEMIQRFNAACVAAWLAARLMRKDRGEKQLRNINTFLGYRSDAAFLLRLAGSNCIVDLEDAEENILAGCLSDSQLVEEGSQKHRERPRVMTAWRSLCRYLASVGLPVTKSSSLTVPLKHSTHYTRLVGQHGLVRLLETCMTVARKVNERGKNSGSSQGIVSMLQQVYMSALLVFYSSLREVECVRLRVCDTILVGIPHLYVRGKGNKRRVVYLDDVPPDFLAILREWRDERMKITNDVGAPLLDFSIYSKKRMTENELSRRLSQWTIKIMVAAGLRDPNLKGESVDLHRLRHDYINRSLVLRHDRRCVQLQDNPSASLQSRGLKPRDDLEQVVKNAGHGTRRVTLERYVHVLNALQEEQLSAWESSGDDYALSAIQWLSAKAISHILDLKRAQTHKKLTESGLGKTNMKGKKMLNQISIENAVKFLDLELQRIHDRPREEVTP